MAKDDNKVKPQAPAQTAPPTPPEQSQGPEEPAIQYVMMRRTTDGDGPHPIHPDEVDNYVRGDWVVVTEAE